MRCGCRRDSVRGDLVTKGGVAEVVAELKAGIAEVKADIKVLKFVYGPIMMALLLKLVSFP